MLGLSGLHGGERVERLYHPTAGRELSGIGEIIILRYRYDVVLDDAQVVFLVRGRHHQRETHLARLLR